MAKYTTVYDKNRDYQALINDAVANNDFESAAVYEQQRNAKINGEGITDYQQTHEWEKYLPTSSENTGYINRQDREYDKYTRQADEFDTLLNNLQGRMMNREAFSYDPESDPLYGVYKDLYTKNGQNAMNDALAQLSARTGGLASSYAGQAAQGAYNSYMDRLNAVVPELRNLAYQMYRDKIGDDEAIFSLLSGRQSRADSLGQSAWDNGYRERNMQADLSQQDVENQWREREWDYGVGQDALAQENWQKQFDNQQMQQALENGWREREWNYETGQDATNRAREEIDAYLAAGGSADNLPAELLQVAGYSPAYIAAMENYYANSVASGGSYSGRMTGGDGTEEAASADDQALARKAVRNYLAGGGTVSGIDAKLLKRSGYTKQELLGILQTNADTGSGTVTNRISTDIQPRGQTLIWNGKSYNTTATGLNNLIADINAANPNTEDLNKIIARLEQLGYEVG